MYHLIEARGRWRERLVEQVGSLDFIRIEGQFGIQVRACRKSLHVKHFFKGDLGREMGLLSSWYNDVD